MPYMKLLGIDISPLLENNGILFYMSGFLWCAVAGMYCKEYVRINLKSIGGVFISLIVLSSPFLVFVIKYMTGVSITSSLSLFSMLTTLYAVVLIYSVDISWIKENRAFRLVVNTISKYSFGIYLCHTCILHCNDCIYKFIF